MIKARPGQSSGADACDVVIGILAKPADEVALGLLQAVVDELSGAGVAPSPSPESAGGGQRLVRLRLKVRVASWPSPSESGLQLDITFEQSLFKFAGRLTDTVTLFCNESVNQSSTNPRDARQPNTAYRGHRLTRMTERAVASLISA
jgi:hypothetical protein